VRAILIRAKLTPAEWEQIRKIAHETNRPAAQLVADTIRESLLKGAKP
jgi:hypothetical protein